MFHPHIGLMSALSVSKRPVSPTLCTLKVLSPHRHTGSGDSFELYLYQPRFDHIPGIVGDGTSLAGYVDHRFPIAGHHRRILTGYGELVFGSRMVSLAAGHWYNGCQQGKK